MNVKFSLFAVILFGIVTCQNSSTTKTKNTVEKNIVVTVDTASTSSTIAEPSHAIALSSNALKIINEQNGSASELRFTTPSAQTIEAIEKVLNSKPSIMINSECGAGPLKMATWENGLTLLFQEDKNDLWLFVGWSANEPKNKDLKLTTMAGIGIGSSRKQMNSVYVINESKTSLGYEFATKSDDLFGIFSGAGEDAKITHLWSGLSCNFR